MAETDREFLRRAITTLGVNQTEMGEILGFTQAAVSFCLRTGSKLQKSAKQELKRRMAWKAVKDVLTSGKIMSLKPCRGHTIKEFDQFLYHMEACPMCLVRAYNHITRGK